MKVQCPECGLESQSGAAACTRCGAPLEIHIDDDRSAYTTPVAPGTIFEGKYQVLEEIGRGGMGVVYRGHDLSLDRLVAIKVLPEQFNTDDEVIARFKREARAMAHLDHPNIVPVYAIGQQRSFHYFVMKYLDGETVAERLEALRETEDPRMGPEIVQHVIVEVCKGLGHAHERGLIHRDIKPGNIMLGPTGNITLMDFGIVKEQSGEDTLTRTGLVFGTPEYMAPEQAQGHAAPGPTTDLYSLGIVAYEMLSGDPPFLGETPFSVVLKHIQHAPPPLVDVIPSVNLALQKVIFKALSKTAEGRWQDAETMRAALAAVDVGAQRAPRRSRTISIPPPSGSAESALDVLDPIMGNETPLNRPRSTVSPSPAANPEPAPRMAPRSPARGVRPRPAIPVRSATPRPRITGGTGIVEDRPGQYRDMNRQAAGRQREERSRRWLWAAVAGAVALTVAMVIVLAT